MIACHATQHSDEMNCTKCHISWDVNDPRPPACKVAHTPGTMTLWPGTPQQMQLSLPDFDTAHALARAINGVTKAAFLQGRESMRGDMLNVPIYKDKP